MVKRLPPLNPLRAFEATARLGSLTRAAGELNVTHGAISHQIKALENALNVRLFERDGARFRLSPQGAELLPAVSSAFDAIAAATARMERPVTAGSLSVTCVPALLSLWVIPRLASFTSRFPEIRLKLEIRHARMYTEIQEMRFYHRIQSSFDELPPEFEESRVPRLIVQPIIENAFEHSLEKKARNGRINVRFEKRERWACILIEDNGECLSDEELERIARRLIHEDPASETTGIVNVHRRIVFTCGEGSGLKVSRSELGGLKVTIRVPLGEENGNVQASDRR